MVGDIPAAITPVAPGLLICGMLLLATEPPLIISLGIKPYGREVERLEALE
jgi:hypothetical protein